MLEIIPVLEIALTYVLYLIAILEIWERITNEYLLNIFETIGILNKDSPTCVVDLAVIETDYLQMAPVLVVVQFREVYFYVLVLYCM